MQAVFYFLKEGRNYLARRGALSGTSRIVIAEQMVIIILSNEVTQEGLFFPKRYRSVPRSHFCILNAMLTLTVEGSSPSSNLEGRRQNACLEK